MRAVENFLLLVREGTTLHWITFDGLTEVLRILGPEQLDIVPLDSLADVENRLTES
jgi:hypothetical protein